MSVITGSVVSINLNIKAKNQQGSEYAAWRLVYTDQNDEVKNITKPIQSLKFNRALEGQLKAIQPGDEVTIVQEKNDKGFLDVKSVTKGVAEEIPTVSANERKSAPAPAASSNSRGFETPEERAQKQVYIARQSSLERAVTLYPKKSPPEIVEVAEFFKDYIFNGLVTAPAATESASIQDLEDDLPYN